MMWCGPCYQKDESDKFHVNVPEDEDGNEMFGDDSDANRYNYGMNGGQFMTPFQCDLCIFRTLFRRNPRKEISD